MSWVFQDSLGMAGIGGAAAARGKTMSDCKMATAAAEYSVAPVAAVLRDESYTQNLYE